MKSNEKKFSTTAAWERGCCLSLSLSSWAGRVAENGRLALAWLIYTIYYTRQHNSVEGGGWPGGRLSLRISFHIRNLKVATSSNALEGTLAAPNKRIREYPTTAASFHTHYVEKKNFTSCFPHKVKYNTQNVDQSTIATRVCIKPRRWWWWYCCRRNNY